MKKNQNNTECDFTVRTLLKDTYYTVNIVATIKSDLLDSCILCVCRMSAVYSSCSYPIFGVVDVKSDGEEADELAGQCTDLHQR